MNDKNDSDNLNQTIVYFNIFFSFKEIKVTKMPRLTEHLTYTLINKSS